jgi:hypothetical protein
MPLGSPNQTSPYLLFRGIGPFNVDKEQFKKKFFPNKKELFLKR